MRRTLLPLLLLLAGSCAQRTGLVPPAGGRVAGGEATSPTLGIDLTVGEAHGEEPGDASHPPVLGIDLTATEAGGPRPGPATAQGPSPSANTARAEATPAAHAPAASAVSVPVPDVAGADLVAPEFATAVPVAPFLVAAADSRARLVGGARRLVGRPFAGDCSGFVRHVLDGAQVNLPRLHSARTMTESLYRSLPHVGRPQPGDLAFFHSTRGRDRPGSTQSRFTHVAMVEKVEGTRVTLIHRGSRGIRRFVMNLARPHDRHENGMVRRRRAQDAPGTRYLAAELFGGYATPVGAKTTAGGRGSLSAARALTDEAAEGRRDATASRR